MFVGQMITLCRIAGSLPDGGARYRAQPLRSRRGIGKGQGSALWRTGDSMWRRPGLSRCADQAAVFATIKNWVTVAWRSVGSAGLGREDPVQSCGH
jgi:hypothetical protein